MSTHTPGPWELIATPESSHADFVVRVGRDRIGVYRESDAALMAAGPDMLAALKIARHFIATLKVPQELLQAAFQVRSGGNTLDAIDAAIAKAEGKTP